jgi:hypothetical protein
MQRIALTLVLAGLACGGGSPGSDVLVPPEMPDAIDITDRVFSSRAVSCADRVGSYYADVRDLGRNVAHRAEIQIEATDGGCVITSNSLPNHDFNDMGQFATAAQAVTESFTIAASPEFADAPTPLSLRIDNAIFLNGVKLDVRAAACYGVGNEPLGQERIGCNQDGTPWRYDPMHEANGFGTDSHHAHTQPDGAYHYHGDPLAMYDASGAAQSGLVGFAADGFPIYGPFIDEGGTVRRVRSGYTLKQGPREPQVGEGAFPGGEPDGRYVDDWEWTDAGDLDVCNGMWRDGSYGYYITDTYPWVLGCFQGTPNPSFRK